ncbi:MAG TPA: hypothetical protein VI753_12370 [Anaerolineales bacterium]|nr:hypothetical protein [Anaerolineales bacterium]
MVEITYLAIAGIAAAAMFFGYGFGLFEGRSQGYKKRKAEEEQQKKDQPLPEPVKLTVDDPGLLRIKDENGLLTLDLDGTRADTSSLSAEQRRRLIEMLTFMRPWLEGRSAPAPAPSLKTPSSPASPSPAPISPGPTTPKPVPPPAAPKASASAKEERPAASGNSIVTQIDAILQAHLAGTPLEERGVFLTQSPEGGVIVYVGLTRYTSVDDVPDAEVKAAIRAAIAEWENKYTPGL